MTQDHCPRVLIVDDEDGMRAALREVLSRRDLDVEMAASGEEALEKLDGAPFDLALSDIRMPGMTGMELLEQASKKAPLTPFIMMTAYGSVEDAVEAMKIGARDYLIKPFSFETVEQVVDSVLKSPAPEPAPTVVRSNGNSGAARRKGMIARHASMKRLLNMVDEIADGVATILIQGESGVGKEVLAREIHRRGNRSDQPFVAVNCAALPEGLLESELFGHEKGSFTGAVLSRKGKFEQANGGTILLDEISEMPLSLQAKLLRVLQEHEIEPIGATRPVSLDIRVMATTNRSLSDWVREGNFREDLFYRLNVISLVVPPLRERVEDILPLAEYFVDKHCKRNGRSTKRIGKELASYLRTQSWRGNVRELENFIERAVLLCRDEELKPENLFLDDHDGVEAEDPNQTPTEALLNDEPLTLEEMERRMIVHTLERVGGNRTRAAEQLGVSVRTIRNKLHQFGLQGV